MSTWRTNIREVTPYTPGEQPNKENMIKLNTNENPYPPSPMVEAGGKEMEDWRLYPDPSVTKLVHALAQYHGLLDEQVFVGVGSDDVLAMSFLTFFNSDKPILFPDITYSFYDVWAELYKIPYKRVPLTEQFRLVKEDYQQENGGIVFPNPNAPTGILEPVSFVEDIVRGNPDSVVIVDEAYIDFGGETCLNLIHRYENLLVVRTYSKSRSLAGLRVGYCMGNKELIEALNNVKQSYNSYTMNQAAIALGTASLKDEDYFREHVAKIISTREWVGEELRKLHFSFAPSSANFLFITHERVKAKDIFEMLKEQDIYVRYFDKPRIDNYLRVTIGTDEQMQQFIDALKRYLNVK
ncbi:MAG: histidinol-phosphate transaminase [Lachnospira sp.]|nr:histidinol-phosphate transaminase [Lachnospira sp.]